MSEFATVTITSTATTGTVNLNGAVMEWNGGIGNTTVTGTYSGTTAKLQYSVDAGTTFVDAGANVTLTANGGGNFELPRCQLRVNVAGTLTGAPSLKAYTRKIRDVKRGING